MGGSGGHHNKGKSSSYACALTTVGIIGVVVVTLVAAISFSVLGVEQINYLAKADAAIFGRLGHTERDAIVFARQIGAVDRAQDYLKSIASFVMIEILAAIVPITLLACIKSMCHNDEGRYFWFARFGIAILVLVLVIFAHGIAALFLTSRATHLSGWILIIAAAFAIFSALCIGGTWKMVIQLIVAALCVGVGLYYLVISPGRASIAGFPSASILP